jgi:hypothetical protein
MGSIDNLNNMIKKNTTINKKIKKYQWKNVKKTQSDPTQIIKQLNDQEQNWKKKKEQKKQLNWFNSQTLWQWI